jgi:hypothetical protein
MYQLSTEKDNKVLNANSVIQMDTIHGTTIVPMFTVQNIFRSEDKDGFKLFFTNIFEIDPDVPKDEPDIIDLNPIFKDGEIKDIVEYYEKNGLHYDTLFHFIIMKGNDKLNDDPGNGPVDFKLDMAKRRILLYNKSRHVSYRFLAYVNNLQIMTIFNSINNLGEAYESEGQENPTHRKKVVLRDKNSNSKK